MRGWQFCAAKQLKHRPLCMSGRRACSLSSSAILRTRARRSAADDESCGSSWAKCSSREGSPKLLKSSGYSDNHVLNTVDTALKKVGLTPFMSLSSDQSFQIKSKWLRNILQSEMLYKWSFTCINIMYKTFYYVFNNNKSPNNKIQVQLKFSLLTTAVTSIITIVSGQFTENPKKPVTKTLQVATG